MLGLAHESAPGDEIPRGLCTTGWVSLSLILPTAGAAPATVTVAAWDERGTEAKVFHSPWESVVQPTIVRLTIPLGAMTLEPIRVLLASMEKPPWLSVCAQPIVGVGTASPTWTVRRYA